MAEGMARESIPGAAFILVRDDRVVLAKGYGQADVASGRAWSPDTTIFPIASITKVFTATAVMQLVDRGKIALNADVNGYLTSTRVPATYPQPVTAAHLLSHTAGLDELPGRRARSAADVVTRGAFRPGKLVRVHPPGELTSYSSYGAALAGLLVQDVSGVAFEDYLRHHIWQPLGMTRTSITPPGRSAGRLATAYEWDDGRLTAIPYEIYHTPPTASILSTLPDMARFMVTHLETGPAGANRILSDSAAELMHRQYVTMHSRVPGWTLGFQVDDINGRRLIEHGGDIGGFSSLMTLLPDEHVGFFVVHHLEGSNLRFDLRQLILDRYFPDSRPRQAPIAQPDAARRLRRFAGTYRASIFCHSCRDGGPNVQDFRVTANDDGTITAWDQRWVEVSPLYFVSADGSRRIGFAEDKNGRVVALTAGSWRVLERVN
ncbi:MAG TPA: serine hydrolase domain-containing protein [Gemmatimonadales bacterium]|nr:serine hydrolase domain-containing protein [Gemmatimonadales bacterium]